MKSASKGADGGESSQPPPAKRPRTDEQLDRKRQSDREKHKANRAETKTQLGNIERNVEHVRSQFDLLLSKIGLLANPGLIHALSDQSTPSEASTSDMPSTSQGQRRGPESSSGLWTDAQSSIASDSPAKATPIVSATLPQLPNMPSMMPPPCRCGIKHTLATDCPSYLGLAMLYQTHMMLASNPDFLTNLPRSPTTTNYMLLDGGNPLSKVLGHGLRQFPIKTVETLWAMLFVNYRMFRVSDACFTQKKIEGYKKQRDTTNQVVVAFMSHGRDRSGRACVHDAH